MTQRKSIRATLGLEKDLTKPGREHFVPEDSVTECPICGTKFGLTCWKHHCRACGKIFCGDCSSNEVLFTVDSRKGEEGYKEKKKRVCDPCFAKISGAQQRLQQSMKRVGHAADSLMALKSQMDSFTGDELTEEQRLIREQLLQQEAEAEALDADRADAQREAHDAEGADEPLEPEPIDETGAYLVFSSGNNGAMYIVWSHEPVEGALAFGKPKLEVPAFKFARDGRWELQRNINGNKSSYYLAWGMFVKNCAKFDCRITDLTTLDGVSPPLPVCMWLHYATDLGLLRVSSSQAFQLDDVDAVAAIHPDVNALEMEKIVLSRFLAIGKEHGAVVQLELRKPVPSPEKGGDAEQAADKVAGYNASEEPAVAAAPPAEEA